MEQCSRYRRIVGRLGREALALAEGPADHGARREADDARLGLPAARLLLAEEPLAEQVAPGSAWCEALARLGELGPSPRPMPTPGGQWRDVYHPLVVHLYLRGVERVRPLLSPDDANWQALAARAAAPFAARTFRGTIAFELWRALCLLEAGGHAASFDEASTIAAVDRLATRTDRQPPGEALHPQQPGEPLDFWTYRELAGLHALGRLSQRAGRAAWRDRVAQVAAFHLQHTQPDYTTYEPWALHVFAGSMQTLPLAEQQLHDAAVHLEQADAGSVVVLALLLAEAYDAMG